MAAVSVLSDEELAESTCMYTEGRKLFDQNILNGINVSTFVSIQQYYHCTCQVTQSTSSQRVRQKLSSHPLW